MNDLLSHAKVPEAFISRHQPDAGDSRLIQLLAMITLACIPGRFALRALAAAAVLLIAPSKVALAREPAPENAGPGESIGFPELFCEGWMASMPGITIRAHVFAEPRVVLVELAGRGRRQSVIVNAESWEVTNLSREPGRTQSLFRFDFEGGYLEIPWIGENESSAAMLMLTGRAAKDILNTPLPGSLKVMVQCHGLQDPGPYPG